MTHDEDDNNLLRFNTILFDVRYKDWKIVAYADDDSGQRYYLQVSFHDQTEWTGRKWRLSPHMTKSEIVQTALMAVLAAEEHEAREKFSYRGRAVFGPHIDVDRMWEVCEQLDTRDQIAAETEISEASLALHIKTFLG